MATLDEITKTPEQTQTTDSEKYRRDSSSDDEILSLAERARRVKNPEPKKRKIKRKSMVGNICEICQKDLLSDFINCFVEGCFSKFHLSCLAKFSTRNDPEQIIPIYFTCPNCEKTGLWGDLIRNHNKFKSYSVKDPEKSPFLGVNRI